VDILENRSAWEADFRAGWLAHHDHTAVYADPQVLLPFHHLAAMRDEGMIGALTPNAVSFMGYQPDAGRVLDELIGIAATLTSWNAGVTRLTMPPRAPLPAWSVA